MEQPDKEFSFKDYSAAAKPLAKYPMLGMNMVYPVMGLAGEAGEACDKIKKYWRNRTADLIKNISGCTDERATIAAMDGRNLPSDVRLAILKELGDPLWYIDACARELGSSLEEVARINIEKLLDRNKRGVVLSEGDNR